MPKQSSRAQHPSSPGTAGAASVDEKGSLQVDGGAAAESREFALDATSTRNRSLNGDQTELCCSECWSRELDQLLTQAAKAGKDERESIRQTYPKLSQTLIWERIVLLGLTDRRRPPYREHEWTQIEDDILRAEYGNGRKGAHAATSKILALHPNWSHDAVAWRAQALGVANHRRTPTRRWNHQLDEALREQADCTLETIARRLGRSHKSILARIRRLGFDADFFGGHKTKDLVRYLRVNEAQVNAWVHLGWLTRKRGRITDDSFTSFCRDHPESIPFDKLTSEAQNWVRSLGYRAPATPQNAHAANQ